MRQFLDIKTLNEKVFPNFTVNQIYKWIHDPLNPIPYKKLGKRLLFDPEKVARWVDSLPGRDGQDLS